MAWPTDLTKLLKRISTPAEEVRDMLEVLGDYLKAQTDARVDTLDTVVDTHDAAIKALIRQYSGANERYENTWYVDGRVAESGDGLSWAGALKTFAEAVVLNNATIDWADAWDWHRWNRILVAPGLYNENLDTPWSCHVFGMATLDNAGVRVEPDAGSPISGASIGLVLDNIKFVCKDANPILDFSSFNNSIVRNCVLEAGADDVVTHGIGVTAEATFSKVLNNKFINHGLTDKGLAYGIYPAGNFYGCIVKGNIMDDIRTAGIYFTALKLNGSTFIEDNTIVVAGAGKGIDDNIGNSWVIRNHVIVKGAGTCIEHANTSHVIKNDVSVNGGAPSLQT